MRQQFSSVLRPIQTIAVVTVALITYVVVLAWSGERVAHALPEYATRTGETCAACHVNPGGGGPRTLRGLLWAAQGRPDAVPELPGLLLAPGVTEGVDLYDVACAGCHGAQGEGLYAIALAGTGISRPAARSFIRRGIPGLGMPAFAGQLTDEQLEILAAFVAAIGSGDVPLEEYPLPTPAYGCSQPPAGCSNR